MSAYYLKVYMFDVLNTRPALPLDSILNEITSLDVDTEALDEKELQAYRMQLGALLNRTKTLMKETAKGTPYVEASKVQSYINTILSDAAQGKATKLSSNSEFVDVQNTTAYQDLIKACVEASYFSSKTFGIKHLSYQRNAIATAKTLHELRQATKAICEPLLYVQSVSDDKELVQWLTDEVETLSNDLDEKTRILNEIMGIYEEGYSDIVLYRNIKQAKKEMNLTDVDIQKVFNISKRKLASLKESIVSLENTELEVHECT